MQLRGYILKEDTYKFDPQEFFDKIGNNIDLWYWKSLALLSSAEAVEGSCGQTPSDPKNEEDVVEWMEIHGITRMLRGMALECMFKALWLKYGGRLAVKGKYQCIPGTKDHDLCSLEEKISEKIDTGLNSEERKLLARLSFFIIYGRYPIRKSISSYPSSPCSDEPIHWCRWIPEDDEILNGVIEKLINLITNEQ